MVKIFEQFEIKPNNVETANIKQMFCVVDSPYYIPMLEAITILFKKYFLKMP